MNASKRSFEALYDVMAGELMSDMPIYNIARYRLLDLDLTDDNDAGKRAETNTYSSGNIPARIGIFAIVVASGLAD
jgi:hypothetical protein